MTVAAVSEVKARLSEYLSKVSGGDEVLITARGKPVARLVPVRRSSASLEALERDGVLRVGSRPLGSEFLDRPRRACSGSDLSSAIIEERREAR